MGSIGIPEMIFIFVLALLIFGPRKLPELGRSLGKALGEFRRASTDLRMTIEDEVREIERQAKELEREAREAVAPVEQPVGSGTIAPSEPASAADTPRNDVKPDDGDAQPA